MFQSVNSLGTWNGSDRTSSEPLQRLGCDPEAGQSGWLEHARQMAGHESPRPTKLYDRTKDETTLSEVERIRL
jgi:hypothetical protein